MELVDIDIDSIPQNINRKNKKSSLFYACELDKVYKFTKQEDFPTISIKNFIDRARSYAMYYKYKVTTRKIDDYCLIKFSKRD